MKKLIITMMVITFLAAGYGADAATKSMSLNPYSALVDGGASLELTGYNGPIVLPDTGTPQFGMGFTIPSDYKFNTPVRVVLLWESFSAADCEFRLASNFLFRAGLNKPRDFGGASSGLEPLGATTPFVLNGSAITMSAPAAPTSQKAVFTIKPTPGEFVNMKAGDAVNFGILRQGNEDSCTQDLRIAGISIVYQTPD